MRTLLAAVLFFILSGIAYPQGTTTFAYDIEYATLNWTNAWIDDNGEWIDEAKTFASSVIYCNAGEPNAIAYTVTAPKQVVPFLDFIKKEGAYTCHTMVVSNTGNEIGPSGSVTFSAAWAPRENTDLRITILQ